MKRAIVLVLLLTAVTLQLKGQVPQKFSYQAALRNSDGTVLPSAKVDIMITLRKDSTDGLAVYSETHAVETNPQGVISLSVGAGTLEGGSFAEIPWAQSIFLQVDVKKEGEADYSTVGVTQIVSVPYALYAGNSIQGEGAVGQTTVFDGDKWVGTDQVNVLTDRVEVKAQTGRNKDEPLFVVKNSNGEVVFEVSETGAKFYIADDENEKGNRGGFAIGGMSGQKENYSYEYLTIAPDSVRFNILDTLTVKGSRGGFAIGGLSGQKQVTTDFLTINSDTTTIFTALSATGDVNISGNLYTSGSVTTQISYNGHVYRTIKIGNQTWFMDNY